MAKQSDITDLAKTIEHEINSDAPSLALALFGNRPAGYERLSKPEYLERVRMNWDNPQFRTDLLNQVGNSNFIKTYAEAFDLDPESVCPGIAKGGILGG